jgi:hypothetical protein
MNMNWLETIAPTIASALGGPLAGLAVEVVSKAIGIDAKDVAKTIAEGKLSADQIALIKVAEIEMASRAQELGLDFAKLAVDDRKSARDMQSKNNALIPGVMAIVVTIGFFGILIGLMTEQFKTSEALLLMLGSLGTAWTGIIGFYFGSSAGSQAKDSMLLNSTQVRK